ncbi:Protein SULFUR DEFICIENCY-INDUCED 2 [Dichanthelium oligosanthes]|uniref:Protein SULFUR DEFICIENCY-INDUCED 2 n=1 Tax=Dichanthelium oligosanthes TaxID=888268 RepID=A0A1E5W125_9POAL|nr:Protein SULFUR DEFICIENCY-INDUCED 2 [Dichanthelium oligosanthes]
MDQLFATMAQPASPTTTAPHVAHKIPSGDGPYARAKHFQLVEKDLDASIAWFWKAINTGDKLDSALKDMAVVMKQRGYLAEAIDAIKSLRHLCPRQSQESLDNILLDLYKASGRTKEEIELLKQKLRKIYLGEAFQGRSTKRARSHGRKIHVSVKQETSRVLVRSSIVMGPSLSGESGHCILHGIIRSDASFAAGHVHARALQGNLAWAYMQQRNFMAAEVVYRKAQMIDPDANKACNLALSLIEQSRLADAEVVLADVLAGRYQARDQQDGKIVRKVEELLARIMAQTPPRATDGRRGDESDDDEWVENEMLALLDVAVKQWAAPYRKSNRRLPVFEEISPIYREQMACY